MGEEIVRLLRKLKSDRNHRVGSSSLPGGARFKKVLQLNIGGLFYCRSRQKTRSEVSPTNRRKSAYIEELLELASETEWPTRTPWRSEAEPGEGAESQVGEPKLNKGRCHLGAANYRASPSGTSPFSLENSKKIPKGLDKT